MEGRIELAYGKALQAEYRKPGDVDVYGSNGRVGAHNAALVNGSGILIGRKGTIGAVHFAPRSFWPIDTVYYVIRKVGDDLKFLHHLLEHLPLAHLNAATGVPGLSRRDAYALRGAFPPPNEQAAIAHILDAVDAAMGRTHMAVERAREVKRALVQQLFSNGLRGERQKKTAIGPIPKSWDVVPVGAVVRTFQYGLSVSMEATGRMPILRMGNIQSGEVVLEDLKYVNLPDKVVKPYIVKRGDVLFNRTNSQEWVGKIGIYRQDAKSVFASYLIRLCPDTMRVDNHYLGQVLSSYSTQCRIKRYATPGVQQVNINATNLGKVLIPVPAGREGMVEQHEIAAVLEAADAVIRSYEPVLAAQEALKKTLRHDLLTGRVRVMSPAEAAAA